MKKRILSMMLSIAMVFTMLPAFSLTARAATTYENVGEGLTATLNNGTLTISGNGAMNDFDRGGAPWFSVRSQITSVVIEEGVTSIGKYAFYFCEFPDFSVISIPKSLKSINESAFYWGLECEKLELPTTIDVIGSNAFYGCGLKYVSYGVNANVADDAFSSNTYVSAYNSYTHTLYYQADGVTNAVIIAYKSNDLEAPSVPERPGFIFTGWYSDADCTNKINFPYPHTADTSLYAGWSVDETYDPNHTHKWSYEVVEGENKINAICIADGCKNTDGGSVSISAVTPAPAYTGSVLDIAELTNELKYTPDSLKIVYTQNETEVEPKNAGTYTASITLDNATVSVECEIVKGNRYLSPTAPTMASFTETTLTLNTKTGCEYSMNGTTWQTSPTFTDLTTGTLYSFYARYAETENQYASTASKAVMYVLGQNDPIEETLTIKATNSSDTITKGTDYTYSNGVLTVKTATPVTIGLLSGVTTTSDQIHIKEVNADVTLDNVTIEIPSTQVTKKALYIEKCDAVTLRIEGTTTINNFSMSGTTKYGYGIEIYSVGGAESVLTITGNGTLNIEASAWALTDSGETTSSVIFDTVTANLKSNSSPSAETMTIQNGATVKIESNTGNSFGVIPSNTVLTVNPTDEKIYRIDSGASVSATTSQYVMGKSQVVVYSHYYFYAEEIDAMPITEASASVDAPVKNGAPDTTADIPSGANYTASAVTWNGNPAKFLGGTAYTATFTLIPDAGYAFVSDTAVTVAGATIVGKTLNDDGSLTVNAKFPATAAAVPVSIAVKTDPTDVEYTYGDEFDPTGLFITVTNDDDTTQDVTYSDGTKDNFSFAPSELTVATTKITVTYANKTAEIDITVAKQPVTAPENAGSKQFTGNTLTADVDVTDKPYTVTTNEGGINVGEYDVVLTLSDPANYKWSDSEEATETIKFNIIQANALTLNSTATMVKNHANHTVEIDLTTISGYPTNPGGTPVFTLVSGSDYNGLTSVALDDSKLTLVANQTSNDTADTVTVNVTGMGNYADTTTITIAVSYTDKTVATITGVEAVEGLVYSGAAQAGYTGTPTSAYTGDYVFSYSGTDKAGNAYGPSAEAPVNAGDYTLTISVPESSTTYSGSTTVNFSIAPKALTITVADKSVYVGSQKPDLSAAEAGTDYTISGLVDGDSITVALSYVTEPVMNKSGEYEITAVASDSNYAITVINGKLKVSYAPSEPTYRPSIEESEGGDVTVTPKNPEQGDKVTIITDPDKGYAVDEVTVIDRKGDEVKVVDNGDGTYTFKQPYGRVTITVTFRKEVCDGGWDCPSNAFSDLDTDLWYHEATDYVIENALMNGIGGGKFNPDGTTSRAMIVTILWRLEGEPVVNHLMQFDDVAEGAWCTEAIRWAAAEGIVGGYGNGLFGTNDPITREQFATILWRYAQYKGYDVSVGENTNILSYEDAFDIAEYAIPAMQWTCGEGLIKGSGGYLMPNDNATRVQAAAILQRFCENVAEK